jgi:hypothetical protein
MALGWLTALKAVPWSDVVQAAPNIVQGARKLFTAAKAYRSPADAAASAQASSGERGENPEARIGQINAHIETLQAEQRASAELIRSLAEQNENIVAALDLMRKRMRMLAGVSILLMIALMLLGLAVARN